MNCEKLQSYIVVSEEIEKNDFRHFLTLLRVRTQVTACPVEDISSCRLAETNNFFLAKYTKL